MATNFYFNNYKNSQEQLLLEDLIIESIKIHGLDVYYVPRRLDNIDPLYGEDATAYFNAAYEVEMYVNSVDGFAGDGNFFSKFGLEIRDQITFTIAQRIFKQEIDIYEAETLIRPREGDLVYLPFNKKCFQIKFVNNEPYFYQMGALQTWQLTCELFEYSNETFETGIEEIDNLQQLHSFDMLDYALKDEDGNFIMTEDNEYILTENYLLNTGDDTTWDNDDIQNESDEFLDFSEFDPFSENGTY